MANPEHVKMLVKSSAEEWNEWRRDNLYELVDLKDEQLSLRLRLAKPSTDDWLADLRGFDLRLTALDGASLEGADLSGAMINAPIEGLFPTPPPAQYNSVSFVRAKMHGAELRNATLSGCALDGADFADADLRESRFPNCTLQGANFKDAKLHGVDFGGADLTGANFGGCDLSTVSLIGAKLACTRLPDAARIYAVPAGARWNEIVDDKFKGSWSEARAWLGKRVDPVDGTPPVYESDLEFQRRSGRFLFQKTVDLGSAATLEKVMGRVKGISETYKVLFGDQQFEMFYRGQAKSKWHLKPSLRGRGLMRNEDELLREMISYQPHGFASTQSAFDRLVVARHHGLPTRFLDVTTNPLVGLYFATSEERPQSESTGFDGRLHVLVAPRRVIRGYDSDTISVLASIPSLSHSEKRVLLTECPEDGGLARQSRSGPHGDHGRRDYMDVLDRLTHFVAREKPYFENRIDPKDFFRVFVVKPRMLFDRLRAQSAAFLLSAYHKTFDGSDVHGVDETAPAYDHFTIDIPKADKEGFLSELALYDIHAASLFPGLDSASKWVTDRYAAGGES